MVVIDGHEVRLTNVERVLYPAAGFRKAEALDYYARIAPTILPHLRGRAMTLKRYPYGVAGPHFYDKHCAGRPDWLPTAPMWSERKGKDITPGLRAAQLPRELRRREGVRAQRRRSHGRTPPRPGRLPHGQ